MKFSGSVVIFLAICLVYVNASQPKSKTYEENRPTSYRPHHPKPHHPLSHKPHHPLSHKPLPLPYPTKPYHPKPHHPLPYHPKPYHPKPHHPKPHHPKPHHPKPHRPSIHRPKPQRPNRPWMMKPQPNNNNININRNKNSNEDIILAELFSQLFASQEEPCLFGMGCFDRKPKTKDIVVGVASEKTQEQEAVTANDAVAVVDAEVSFDQSMQAEDQTMQAEDQTMQAEDQTMVAEEEDAVVLESRQDAEAREDDAMPMA